MSSNFDDIQAAGSDTCPPMLDRTDYDLWSQRIWLYCRGKENGIYILQSIDHGPFELGTTRDTLGTTPKGGALLRLETPHTYDDLNDNEKKRFDANVREMVQLEIGEHRLELEMSMQVKGNQSSVLTNGVVLNEEDLLFLTGEQTNNFNADVDDHPDRDLALNDDNIFQADECDAFDSDVDDEPTGQSIFMANLSSAGPTNQQAGPSNASILSEVHELENAIDSYDDNQDEHVLGSKVFKELLLFSTVRVKLLLPVEDKTAQR
nr:integrase, catalytic region, zinc finger, CCHC-type, peptidase aspartic, catalytic [Tanacetum cinerariifolium]